MENKEQLTIDNIINDEKYVSIYAVNNNKLIPLLISLFPC